MQMQSLLSSVTSQGLPHPPNPYASTEPRRHIACVAVARPFVAAAAASQQQLCCLPQQQDRGCVGVLTLPEDASGVHRRRSAAAFANSSDTLNSSSDNGTSTGAGSGSASNTTAQDPIGYMNEMAQFMSQFSEEDLMAAYARAAQAMEDMQQQQPPQQDDPADQQQAGQQQQQRSKIPANAVSYLQTVLQRAQERSMDGSGISDPMEYLRSSAGRGLLWEVLKEQFTADETSLLDMAFGSNWQQFGQQQQLDMSQLARMASLEPSDVGKLGGLLDKLNAMSRQMDTLSAQLPKAPQTDPSTTSSTTTSSSSSTGSQPKAKPWGTSLLRRAASQAARAGGGNSSSRTRLQVYRWDVPLLTADPMQRLQRLLVLSSGNMQQQQQQWGIPASQQFQILLRLFQQLVQLEAAQVLFIKQQQQQQQQQQEEEESIQLPGVQALDPEQAEAVYGAVSSELNWLVRQVSDEDTASKSAFWYINALQDPSWQASTATSSASGSAGGPGFESMQQQAQQVSLQRLGDLGVFLAAAANLEPLRAWATACAETRPEAEGIPELQEVLAALSDDWFIKPHMRQQALSAAEAAAAAAADAERRASPAGSSSSSIPAGAAGAAGPPGGAFGLQPDMIDRDRVLQMGCLDTTLVWFLAEMEAAPEPKQVVMKWALHPSIGPKLKGKNWLQRFDLQEPLLSVYNRLRVANYMSQV